MPFKIILPKPFAKVGLKWAKLAKIIILCIKVILFGFNGPNTIRKQSYWVSIGYGDKNCPFLVKNSIFGLLNCRFWCQFGLLNVLLIVLPIISPYCPYMMTGILGPPSVFLLGKLSEKMHLEGQKGFKTPQKLPMAAQHKGQHYMGAIGGKFSQK